MQNYQDDTFFDCYYHQFESTGSIAIDSILRAIAMACKSYHNIECWSDAEDCGEHGYWTMIQQCANDAAKQLTYNTSMNNAMRKLLLKQKNIEPEFVKIVEENFWDLIYK